MIPSLLAVVSSTAVAQEPVAYRDALVAALAHNGILAESQSIAAQAEGSVEAVQGGFDPLYELEAWTAGSREEGFFQGYGPLAAAGSYAIADQQLREAASRSLEADAAQIREGIETRGHGSSATWTADRS